MSTRPQPTFAASMPSVYSSSMFSAMVEATLRGECNSTRWSSFPGAIDEEISKMD